MIVNLCPSDGGIFSHSSLVIGDGTRQISMATLRDLVPPHGTHRFDLHAGGGNMPVVGRIYATRLINGRVLLQFASRGHLIFRWYAIDDSADSAILDSLVFEADGLVKMVVQKTSSLAKWTICGMEFDEGEVLMAHYYLVNRLHHMSLDGAAEKIRAMSKFDFDRTKRDRVLEHAGFLYGGYYGVYEGTLVCSTKPGFRNGWILSQWNSVPGVQDLVTDLEGDGSNYCQGVHVRRGTLEVVSTGQAKKGKDVDVSTLVRFAMTDTYMGQDDE